MPIHPPGKRNRRNKRTGGAKRKIVGVLTLTAMVDMFTVLTIFLLQNYDSKLLVVNTPKGVTLPKASSTKELKPAHIVTLSDKDLLLDETRVATIVDVKSSKDWLIPSLHQRLTSILESERRLIKSGGIGGRFKEALGGKENISEETFGKITVQADKNIDILTVKKIMYTVTEAGAVEINFAVTKKLNSEVNN